MRAYRWSVRLKLGLIVFAVLIAIASLWYTHRLVDQLREREQSITQLWADAQAQVAEAQHHNPHQAELRELRRVLETMQMEAGSVGGISSGTNLSSQQIDRFRRAVAWAEGMPPTGELNFILDEILEPNPFGVPAIITDSTREEPLFWRNVGVPETLDTLATEDSTQAAQELSRTRDRMEENFEPIPINITYEEGAGAEEQLRQYVFYEESTLIRELRAFPYVQLVFVGLFVFVGYVGFSYVRKSEQSNLWVGMAREAAHQLGTPISSLMGWIEILRLPDVSEERRREAVDEIENDVERLQQVANRFSDIGSVPKVERQQIAPIIQETTAYIQRRIPETGQTIDLHVDVPEALEAPVNEELFAWVIENLLKNALDAIEDEEGSITIEAYQQDNLVCVEVSDTGRGIERSEWRNVFRPGFSTKQRGWGLGLSLAKRVVEDYHKGTIALESSTVGEGTTFRIDLPAND